MLSLQPTLLPIRAFTDNYIWTLADGSGRAVIVDPGDAAPVLAACEHGLAPVAILVTHHHPDHIGGIAALLERFDVPVFAPFEERIALPVQRVADGERIRIDALNVEFDVLAVPGHTRSHIAFHARFDDGDVLFCGDTLFSLGCGRMFEGTPEQMLASLDRLAALPDETKVCCAHEYTLGNAAFARHVDPDNAALAQRIAQARAQRSAGEPTLPSRLADERACNPFLRCDVPAIAQAVAKLVDGDEADRVETFARLRHWKDGFVA